MKGHNLIAKSFLAKHPREAARTLDRLPAAFGAGILATIDTRVAAEVIAHMIPLYAVKMLEALGPELARSIVRQIPSQRIGRLFRAMDQGQVEKYLHHLPLASQLSLQYLLRYNTNTVGSAMATCRLVFSADQSIAEATRALKKHPEELDCEFFIVDARQQLIGTITSNILLRADPHNSVSALRKNHTTSLPAGMKLGIAATSPVWEEHVRVPVIETDGTLVGVVSIAQIRAALQHASTETFGAPTSGGEDLIQWYCLSLARLIEAMTSRPRGAGANLSGQTPI